MSLQKQLAHLNITGGLSRSEDPRIAIPSKLVVADNVEFDDLSTVRSRGGQASVALPAGYPPPVRAFTHRGGALLEMSDGATVRANAGPLGYSDVGAWSGDLDPAQPRRYARVGATQRRVPGSPAAVGAASGEYDVATGTTTYCLVWVDSIGGETGLRISVRRASDDAEMFFTAMFGASGETVTRPRVIFDPTSGHYAVFGYFEDLGLLTASIKGGTFAEAGGTLTPASLITMAVDLSGTIALMDVAFLATYGYCVVGRDAEATNRVRIRVFDTTLTALTATSVYVPATALNSITAHMLYSGGTRYGYALYGAGANLRGRRLSDAGVLGAETTIATVGGTVIGQVAAVEVSGNLLIAADSTPSTSATYATTYVVSASNTLAALSQTDVSTNCFLAGRTFSMHGRNYVPVVFEGAASQGTLFVLDLSEAALNLGATGTNPYFIARLSAGEVAHDQVAAKFHLRLPASAQSLLLYRTFETDLRLLAGANVTGSALTAAALDDGQLGACEINGLTFLAGACPMVFDGRQVVEEGFHWAPEVSGGALVPAAAGILTFPNATATYTVVFTEGWTDAQGNWHESGVAAEYPVTITAGSGLYSVNPTLIRPPSLKGSRELVMYRTLGSSTNTSLYLTGASTSEAALPSGEQIYTAGGVLPNTPAPSCRHVSAFQKRLVLAGCGDGSRVHWSKTSTPGYGVEFSAGDPSHQTTVPSDKGRVVATQEMDDRLLVFCERGVSIISGSGPAPTGLTGQYSEASTIIPETGCSWDSPKSVLRGPEGVWFRSPQGIRMVSRGGALAREQDGNFVGSQIDDLVSGSVVALSGETKQQARFYQSSGTCLVWDYQWLQWTRFTGMGNDDAVYADGRFYTIYDSAGTGLLRYTLDGSSGEVDDAGDNALVDGVIETPWLSFAGVQGFQRVYRLMVLGEATASTLRLQLSIYYDFSTASPETATVDVAGGTVQVQHHLARQKCETMKIRLVFSDRDGNDVQFRLSDLTLQVGAKFGYNKLPSSQRF